jgi:DNA-binding NarL/FixJ family response regulator
MSSEILNVLLVDDHAVVRRGLRAILESKGNIACAEAGSAEDALELLDSGVPLDVVLLDISLPGMSGLDALAEIRQRRPQLAVLLVSMFPEEEYATRALR